MLNLSQQQRFERRDHGGYLCRLGRFATEERARRPLPDRRNVAPRGTGRRSRWRQRCFVWALEHGAWLLAPVAWNVGPDTGRSRRNPTVHRRPRSATSHLNRFGFCRVVLIDWTTSKCCFEGCVSSSQRGRTRSGRWSMAHGNNIHVGMNKVPWLKNHYFLHLIFYRVSIGFQLVNLYGIKISLSSHLKVILPSLIRTSASLGEDYMVLQGNQTFSLIQILHLYLLS